jgi:hypothetical protein
MGLIRHNGIDYGWYSGVHLAFSIDGLATSIFTVIKVWELTAQARLKETAPAARFPLLIPVPFHISHLV